MQMGNRDEIHLLYMVRDDLVILSESRERLDLIELRSFTAEKQLLLPSKVTWK